MKKFIIPVLAIILAFGASAFTAKKTTSVLYKYQGATFTQTDIQTASNYIRSELGDCDEGGDVCGVLLPTDNGANSTPTVSEFNGEKSNLWLSQQHSAPQDGNIEMQPE